MEDPLGGDFYVDVNQFGERDFPTNPSAGQNNVLIPNRIVGEGDKFGYNYDLNIKRGSAWVAGCFQIPQVRPLRCHRTFLHQFLPLRQCETGLFPNNSTANHLPILLQPVH